MIAIEQKNNRSKLLVAVFALAVVMAGCVVMFSDDTQAVTSADFNTEISENDGVYTVNGNEVLTVTEPITGLKEITGSGSLTINFQATQKYQSMIVVDNTAGLKVDGSVTVILNMTAVSTLNEASDGLTVFGGAVTGGTASNSNGNITVSGGASLTISQAASAHGASWRAGDLIVNSATVDFNGANSTGNLTVDLDNATLKFTNPNSTPGNLSGTADNSTIVATGATMHSLNFSDIALNNSTVDTDGDVGVYEGQTMEMTGDNSSVTANKMYTKSSNYSDTAANISGGTVNADIVSSPEQSVTKPGMNIDTTKVNGNVSPDTTTSSEYTLNGVSVTSTDVVYSGILKGDTEGKVNIPANAKLISITVNPGITVIFEGNAYTMYGDSRLYGILDTNVESTTITVDPDSSITAYTGAEIKSGVHVTGQGKVDLSAAMNTGNWSEDISSNITWSQSQKVIIDGTMTIKSGWSLTVLGELVIDEGVRVIIEDGATLQIGNGDAKAVGMTVNGTIEVDENGNLIVANAEDVAVSGSITSSGKVNISSAVNVNNGGSILIDDYEGSKITVTGGLTIQTGGQITVSGEMQIDTITNKGTVTLDGAVISKASTINMAADGAVADIKSFTASATGASLTVTDNELEFADKTTVGINDQNRIVFVPKADDTGIGGVTITEHVTSKTVDKKPVYSSYVSISGSASFVDNREDTDQSVTNNINIAATKIVLDAEDSLNIGKNIILSLNKGTFEVAGTLTAIASDSQITYDADDEKVFEVSGLIQTINPINDNINAFEYEADVENVPNYYYTNLTDAVASGTDTIRYMGAPKVTESVTIPAGVTLRESSGTFNPTEDIIAIGSTDARDVVVTVADGATVRSSYIDVDGSLVFENNRNSNRSTNHITSDVMIDDEPKRTYTNIYTALDVEEGTITITAGNTVYLDKDATINAGVTLVVPANTNLMLYNDVTLTVNGTLQNSGNVGNVKDEENGANGAAGFDPDVEDHASIIVNGTFKNMTEQPYNAYYIAGAYYLLVNTDGSWYYITPVEQAAAVSNDVENGAIGIFGENTIGDVTFTGDETTPVTVTVTGTLNAGTVTLDRAGIDVAGSFTGTAASANGSVDAVNAKGFSVIDTYVDETEVTYLDGEPAVADAEQDSSVTVSSGTINAGQIDLTVTGATDFIIAENATLSVSGQYEDANASVVAQKMTVDGTMIVSDNGNVNVTALTVRGTFTVSPADNENDIEAGSATVETLYVGIASEMGRTGTVEYFVDASAATVNADAIRDLSKVYVSGESTITGDLTKNMKSTEFYVEDALWLTIYTTGTIAIDDNLQPGDLVDNEFQYWADADGNRIVAADNAKVGDYDYQQVYANLNYDIYTVTVFADPGITAVYIDGKLMTSGIFKNNADMWNEGFQLKVSAGTHEITYKLGNYYSGEAQMTVNGQSVSGNSFTTSGTSDVDKNVTIYLQGIEASAPETPSTGGSSDDGIGLTEILLIILVILIVVMAIIVALRLMRS